MENIRGEGQVYVLPPTRTRRLSASEGVGERELEGEEEDGGGGPVTFTASPGILNRQLWYV
jgi:hypothetical protein